MDASSLAQVENLCRALYEGNSATQRAEAQVSLLALQSSVDFLPQCQYILDNSSLAYAQLLASTSLEVLITQYWNKFTVEQKVEIRNYVLNFLATHAHGLTEFVADSLCKLSCRITKLGWFDSNEHREIIEETSKFLQATIDHQLIGIRLLFALVEEMNSPTTGRTLTLHRKTAVSFRDNALYQTFKIAITTLQQIQTRQIVGATPDQEVRLSSLALKLANSCLSFDFIGTNPEESSEDVGTIQVPSGWRPVVQDSTTMQIFFDIYRSSAPPRSNYALEAIVQLSSIRRSLFATDKERTMFLQFLMTNILDIMKSKQGLDCVENYHEFCRLLGRLKASYQLSELVVTVGFMEFLEHACEFTITSLLNWEYSMNSIHYLLALWGRLVAAIPYLRSDAGESQRQAQLLRECVLRVVYSYMNTMLESVDRVVLSDGGVEDPLDDDGSLKEQMDRLPVLARLQYDLVSQHLIGLFDRTISQYNQAVSVATVNAISNQMQQQLTILEGRLTWLTHMVASVIGGQTVSDIRKSPSYLLWDGQLSRFVFQLINILDTRLLATSGKGKADKKLELAILFFLRSFKKSFIVESNLTPSTVLGPSGVSAHPLLSFALSYGADPADGMDGSQEASNIFEVMNLGDMPQVMNLLVNKLCNNVKFWNSSDEILEQTLEVFVELVTTYGSSKTLLSLETVNFLVLEHTGKNFPFLGYDSDNKYRITFYSALSRLVFSSAEDLNNSFDAYIEPNLAILRQLSQTAELRDRSVRLALIGCLRDLRGITSATHNKRSYNLLFDVLYPDFFPLFQRVANTWFDDHFVMTALLKFMQEFVYNKGQRITFEQSSANGILLFRETSAIICAYGSRILSLPVLSDIYLEKYKGIRLMFNTLSCALSGNYCNYGVFGLYNDNALQNALDVCLQVCLQIPIADVLTYIKLSKAYYAFLEVLFRNHLDMLSQLDSAVFIQLVQSNHEGLQSSDMAVSALCAGTIDHIATFMFLNFNKEKPTVQMIRAHISSEPDILHKLMATLFNLLLFNAHANHWAVTRPILSLMLASEDSFTDYQANLINTQTAENQEKLREEFSKLTADVERSVDVPNRDRFTQKLTLFRLGVRQFLSL